MRLLQMTTRKRLISQLLLVVLSPVLVASQFSLCFCSDGYGICTDCRDFENHINGFVPQNDSSLKNACGCCHKNIEIENTSVLTQQNIDENCETGCTCVNIGVSLASVNSVLNEKEQINKVLLFPQILSSVVLPFQTIAPNFTAFSNNEPTCRLSVRLHLLHSVLLI
ncbi:MAG: hypothetical protein LBJ67_19090 [Planctomycetaceae bacterium]|jgi:hypothetical protein|nr:hypothetical protein [Planctomycetaceae bacterium]